MAFVMPVLTPPPPLPLPNLLECRVERMEDIPLFHSEAGKMIHIQFKYLWMAASVLTLRTRI